MLSWRKICVGFTLWCVEERQKVEKLLLKVCQFSNSNSTSLKSKIITLKYNCLENHSTHLLEFLKWIFWKMLNSSCYPDTNFTPFFPCIFNCMQYIFNCTRQKKYRLNLFLKACKSIIPNQLTLLRQTSISVRYKVFQPIRLQEEERNFENLSVNSDWHLSSFWE